MSTATVRGEDVMTDYQFKALLQMVLNLMRSNKPEDAQKMLEDLIKGKMDGIGKTDNTDE